MGWEILLWPFLERSICHREERKGEQKTSVLDTLYLEPLALPGGGPYSDSAAKKAKTQVGSGTCARPRRK